MLAVLPRSESTVERQLQADDVSLGAFLIETSSIYDSLTRLRLLVRSLRVRAQGMLIISGFALFAQTSPFPSLFSQFVCTTV